VEAPVGDPTKDFMLFLGYCNHCNETVYIGYTKGIVMMCDCLEERGVVALMRTVKTGPNGKKRGARIIIRVQGNLGIREQLINGISPV
jgi:hypothetical protein